MKLTLSRLVALGVCDEYVDRFAKKFGESVDVTEDAAESVASQFSWESAANIFLDAEYRWEFFSDATEACWETIKDNPLLEKAQRDLEDAEEEVLIVEEALRQAKEKLREVEEVVYGQYERLLARAWARAYNHQEEDILASVIQ